MKRLHTFPMSAVAEVELVRQTLEAAGIRCLVRNTNLRTALGEIPFTECYPEIWVLDDDDLPAALRLLEGWQQGRTTTGPAWDCPGCGERLDGQFDRCWQCGRPRPDTVNPPAAD